jgi:S-DNA-T family DNA segregation ATPase FtsK/SpoIIIE
MAVAASSRPLASPGIALLIRRRFAELGAYGLAAASALLLLALVSYSAADPSLDTATAGHARNLLGPPGAVVADLLLQVFGLAAGLPVVALAAWAFRLFAGRGTAGLTGRLVALILATPVLAGVFAALPGPHGAPLPWPVAAGPGGAVGALLAHWVLDAGDALFPHGAVAAGALGAVLAVLLMLLALGLSRRDWRVAGGVATGSVRQGRRAAGLLSRAGQALTRAGLWVFHRAEGTPTRSHSVDAEPGPRREPRVALPDDDELESFALPDEDDSLEPSAPRAVASSGAAIVAPIRPRVAATARKTPPPRQETLKLDGQWHIPSVSLLRPAPARGATGPSEDALQANARLLENVLSDYGVQGQIVEIRPGPVVTLYELEPAPGIRSARVIGLADDVARSLSVTAVRIATVPGRNVIGIEVPNARRETVFLSELLGSEEWDRQQSRLVLALGKDIGGEPVVADLARMPHLLVAGTTGSGKSVGINAMILSLLYRLSPEECRLILIDPKMLELSVYDGIPHLMAPVVTEPGKAVTALKWTVREMERRYRAMSQLSVRNIGGYNERVAEARAKGEVVTRRVQTGFDPETGKPMFEEQALALERLPFIVVVIDEMADLMMVAGKEIEAAVQRLAQMARAAGIHVVMATQRPSVDVITGTIKANFPTRISFQVISKFDSRTILGEQGAEQLLGQGDMLYMMGGGRTIRVHGPFVSDREVEDVVAFLREQGEPAYLEEVTEASDESETGLALSGIAGASDGEKGLFDQAVNIVAREGKASTSFLQRHLQIGYNRAAKLIEQMEKEGVVGPANHVGKREVLVRHSDD